MICTDLDGTLLNDDYQISPENEEAIRYFQAEGGRLTFITGRLYCFAQGSYDPQEIDRLEQLLKSHPASENFTLVRSVPTLFEILPKGIHKGTVLPVLAKQLGIWEDRVIAIGDYDNDAGMLKTAHLGVAVANATEKAKAAADVITVSNQEHALAQLTTTWKQATCQCMHRSSRKNIPVL